VWSTVYREHRENYVFQFQPVPKTREPEESGVKYLMTYRAVPDFAALARQHGPAHLARLREFHERGVLLMAGPLEEPMNGDAIGVFTTPEAAEEFIAGDPFVRHGVVAGWTVRPWREALRPDDGTERAAPRPDDDTERAAQVDREGPQAGGLMPTVAAVVRDERGRLLLVHLADDCWALPGGAMRFGESVADAAIRAVAEQAGVPVEITDLVGLYTTPSEAAARDGEVGQELRMCFHARPTAGEPGPRGTETETVWWAEVSELDELPIHPSVRTQINDALGDRTRPRIA
jgi:ADP-ribose pyrophosphatase YjhB (NUDIX family)/uncharacterized protein YciI